MDEYWTRGCVPCHRRINCVGSPAGKLPRGSGVAPVKTGGGNRAAGAIIRLRQGHHHARVQVALLGHTCHCFVHNIILGPKSVALEVATQARKRLGYMTPSEYYTNVALEVEI